MALPVAGRSLEAMMVKGHEPMIDELLTGLKAQLETRAAA